MKRSAFCVVVAASMAVTGQASAEEAPSKATPRLELVLVDGSRIIGVPGIESVPVFTDRTEE